MSKRILIAAQPSPSISGTVHAQFAEGLHFSAFHARLQLNLSKFVFLLGPVECSCCSPPFLAQSCLSLCLAVLRMRRYVNIYTRLGAAALSCSLSPRERAGDGTAKLVLRFLRGNVSKDC